MPHQLVKQPNGRLAVFSTVVDDFLVYNATPAEIIAWSTDEGTQRARESAERWVNRGHFKPFEKAIATIRNLHGDDEANEYMVRTSEPVETDEEDEAPTFPPIEMKSTERGFTIGDFTDRYGISCSIQESSLATEAALWLGVADPKPEVLVPGQGWKPVNLEALVPGELSIHTRMHLTQDMACRLIPLLQHFVDTGELPKPAQG